MEEHFINNFSKKGLKIHFLGIGGVSMRALAEISYKRGNIVTGTDINPVHLDGIEVFQQNENIHCKNCDFVVYTQDIPKDNIEYIYCKENNIPLFHRAEYLDFLTSDRFKIAITGTSGKTSTTFYTSQLLEKLDPFVFFGEKVGEKTYREGKGPYIVELNEADMIFHKERANVILFTNYGFDHIWNYKNEDELLKCYENLFSTAEYVFYQEDCLPIEIGKRELKQTKFIKTSNFHIIEKEIKWFEQKTTFEFNEKTYSCNLFGDFSIKNLCNILSMINHLYSKELKNVQTNNITHPHRRFEIIYKSEKLVIIDDQALYPKELQTSLNAVKNFNKPIYVIADPFRSIRVNYFLKDFVNVLSNYTVAVFHEELHKELKNSKLIKTTQDIIDFLPKEGILFLFYKQRNYRQLILNHLVKEST